MAELQPLKLGARPLHLADLRRIYTGPVPVSIDPAALSALEQAHAVTARLAAADAPAYGINTGFGLLAQTRIAARAAHAPAAKHHPFPQRRRRTAAR